MLRSKWPLLTLITLCVTLIATISDAETSQYQRPLPRPKIGLVLSGGGALGFAHIGVLKILEQQHIPIDFIAGTSMGALVGAAYSSGCSLDDIEQTLSTLDWNELFNESTDRSKAPYRLKSGVDGEILGTAKVGVGDNISSVPLGLIEGQKVLPLLQRLYGKAPISKSFDALPIPFRAVAANIESGAPVVLKSGDLALAARASMAVPGVFSPVVIDGVTLVDGGVANNLPIDIVRQMGADIVIAVDLPADLKTAKDLTSLFSVSGQILSLLLAQNSKAQRDTLTKKDILISVDVKGFSTSDFVKNKQIEDRGFEAANNSIGMLTHYAVPAASYASWQSKRLQVSSTIKPIITAVRINNNSRFSDEYLEGLVTMKPGDVFNREQIEKDVEGLHDIGAFSQVTYGVVQRSDSQQELVYTVNEKNWYPEFIRLFLGR